MSKEYEITASVKIEAGVHFKVDAAEWLAMTNDERKKLVSDKLDAVSNVFSNDVMNVGECTLSGQITTPGAGPAAIDLSDVDAYDAESGDYDETHLNDGNPFDPESPEGRAWRNGIEFLKPADPDLDAAGYAAAAAGVMWWNNPHAGGSTDAYQWDQGHTRYRQEQMHKNALTGNVAPNTQLL